MTIRSATSVLLDHPIYYATTIAQRDAGESQGRKQIKPITASGTPPTSVTLKSDVIVFRPPDFDAMNRRDPGRCIDHGARQVVVGRWAHGPETYIGDDGRGLPQSVMITGPAAPSVTSNMAVSIEQHVDWVVDRLARVRAPILTT